MRYTEQAIQKILNQVSKRKLSLKKAYEKLKHLSYETLPFAKIDHHRPLRKNFPEVVYAPGKTIVQLEKIISALIRKKQPLLITRLEEVQFRKLKKWFPKLQYSKMGRIAYISQNHVIPERFSRESKSYGSPTHFRRRTSSSSRKVLRALSASVKAFGDDRKHNGLVSIVTAGTSDIPVAEEAKITLEVMGRKTKTFYDLGVAGLHRLLDYLPEIEASEIVICVAGMEGALPSVLAGLISKPMIAVPTSVGYGAGFKGITPLLTMLNTCAQGVAVVNIDSGFNAACFAHLVLPSHNSLS